MRQRLSVLLVLTMVLGLLSGCGMSQISADRSNPSHTTSDINDTARSEGAATPSSSSDNSDANADAEMFSDRDRKTDYDASRAVTIQLNGTSAQADSDSVRISGTTVSITEEATYMISGTLNDGMLVVNAKDTAKIQLVFNGVSITSGTSAALYVLEADKVFVTLADGTENTLANGGDFVAIDDNNIDAALFSKQDLTLNGGGSLTVTSPAGHGIVCKDDLVITGGSYTVHSASHGLDANDSVRIDEATLTIDAGKDAIHSENDEDTSKGFIYIAGGTVKAEAEGDGIAAGAYLQVEGGTIDLLVGGGSENGTKEHSDGFGNFMGGGGFGGGRPGRRSTGVQTAASTGSSSMKGLKAAANLRISDGNITIDSADDAIHSDASLTIRGGTLTLASGDDAVHAEDTLTVTAGNITISESYEGLEALHIDVSGGDIRLKTSDDGLNAAGGTDQSGTSGGRDGMYGGFGGPGGMSSNSNGSIKISGGTLYIHSSGDGMDANGTLEISGGQITSVGPTQGDTAVLDYDKSGVISGGTFIGTGSTMMAQSLSGSGQGVIAIRSGNQGAGTQILLKDAAGNVLVDHQPELGFTMVILSTPDLVKGETYTLTIGTATEEVTAS